MVISGARIPVIGIVTAAGIAVFMSIAAWGATDPAMRVLAVSVTNGRVTNDHSGTLFWTDPYGGPARCSQGFFHDREIVVGCGQVFILAQPSREHSGFTRHLIYQFDGSEGSEPEDLAVAANGTIYGIAPGTYTKGVVFQLTPPTRPGEKWHFSKLHAFEGLLGPDRTLAPDGSRPQGPLILDAEGNLYGTCFNGGTDGGGIVFELSPPRPGQTEWRETILHQFGDASLDGRYSSGLPMPLNNTRVNPVLVRDAKGRLFGSTYDFEDEFGKFVFMLTPPAHADEPWGYSQIYGSDQETGASVKQLMLDPAGNLYGIEQLWGNGARDRTTTLRRFTPPASGKGSWHAATLYTFTAEESVIRAIAVLPDAIYGNSGFQAFRLHRPHAPEGAWSQEVLYRFSAVGVSDRRRQRGGIEAFRFDRATQSGRAEGLPGDHQLLELVN